MHSFLISQPYGKYSIGGWILEQLRSSAPKYNSFRAVTAFVQGSGVASLDEALTEFARQGGTIEIIAGVDMGGTSYEGLLGLCRLSKQTNAKVYICKNPKMGIFHPKGYRFSSEQNSNLYIGSGNLSASGLYRNYELGLVTGEAPVGAITNEFDSFFNSLVSEKRTTRELDHELLEDLRKRRWIVSEAEARSNTTSAEARKPSTLPSLFEGWKPERSRIDPAEAKVAEPVSSAAARRFVMTLQQTDVGIGQVTAGTSRRSPEIFIPLAALRSDLDFWQWDKFVDDETWTKKSDADGYGKRDRNDVRFFFGGEIITVNMFYNPDKGDFRLRSEFLRSAGSAGDILEVERVHSGPFEYSARVIPSSSADFDKVNSLCQNAVLRSPKRWGFF